MIYKVLLTAWTPAFLNPSVSFPTKRYINMFIYGKDKFFPADRLLFGTNLFKGLSELRSIEMLMSVTSVNVTEWLPLKLLWLAGLSHTIHPCAAERLRMFPLSYCNGAGDISRDAVYILFSPCLLLFFSLPYFLFLMLNVHSHCSPWFSLTVG